MPIRVPMLWNTGSLSAAFAIFGQEVHKVKRFHPTKGSGLVASVNAAADKLKLLSPAADAAAYESTERTPQVTGEPPPW